jgi:hypothetical protein
MSDRLHIVYNAADAITHFDELGLQYPNLGEAVAVSDILQVIESRRRRIYALLGFTACGDEVVLNVLDVDSETMTVEDRLGSLSEPRRVSIATDPTPRVSHAHGDLLFDLMRAQNG